jgi:hypothetical protein
MNSLNRRLRTNYIQLGSKAAKDASLDLKGRDYSNIPLKVAAIEKQISKLQSTGHMKPAK